MKLLVFNAGSSSLKYRLFEISRDRPPVEDHRTRGIVERIGETIPSFENSRSVPTPPATTFRTKDYSVGERDTSHAWENAKNERSHQDPSLAEALLGESTEFSRIVFPRAQACSKRRSRDGWKGTS